MDDENQRELFLKLLSKRRQLVDMRKKVTEISNNKNLPHSQHDNEDMEQHLKDGVGDTLKTAPHKQCGDYDSDDSVKDKDFVPDYDSSCSHISGSSDSSERKRKIAKVKRRILLSPVKNKRKENNECITLEDLLGSTENVENNMSTDENMNLWDHESCETTGNTQEPKSTLQIKAMIHHCGTPDIFDSQNYNIKGKDDRRNTNISRENHRELILDTPDLNDIRPYNDPFVTNTTIEHVPENLMIDQDNYLLENLSNRNDGLSTANIMTATKDGTIFLSHDVNSGTSGTCDPINQHQSKEKSRKRSKNVLAWQRVSAKNARAKGSPYHSSVAKKYADVEGRQVKDPCSCKSKCYEKVSPESRLIIFQQFWKTSNSWEQRRQFVARNVTKKTKSMMRTTGDLDTDRRKFTYTYSLISNFESIPVCKVMFLNTLCVGEKFVKVSLDKQLESGMTIPDLRGRHVPANKTSEVVIQSVIDHINSYPCYESHYSRQKSGRKFLGPDLNIPTMYKHYKELMTEKQVASELIAKEWIYRHLFNTKFNLSFKLPSVDTCDDCDSFARKIFDVTDETEREQLDKQKEEHGKLAEKRYELKRQDKEEAQSSQGKKVVLMVDMPKCMATPNLTNSKSFYLRKLWTLNLTIFESERNVATNMIWSENIGARGGNEVASCLIRWAEENHALLCDLECLTIWSDNCGGQNRNTMVIMAYMWLMHKFPSIKVINHKFMLKGHTHMEVDQVHSQIEKKKKMLKTMEIAIPRDWSQFIRTCGGKRKFHVYDMELSHFKDLTTLHKKNAPFVLRKKKIHGDDFKISECVWLQLRKENPGNLFYKYSFEKDFSQISLLRNTSRDIRYPNDLPNVRNTQKPISEAKYKDILKLLDWVPAEYHAFYKNLPYNDKETDFPEND